MELEEPTLEKKLKLYQLLLGLKIFPLSFTRVKLVKPHQIIKKGVSSVRIKQNNFWDMEYQNTKSM